MKTRFTTRVRMLGLALLILACSPVTAPFSTFDLVSLSGDATAPATASFQSKKAPDEPTAALAGPVDPAPPVAPWARLSPRLVSAPQGFASRHQPLRI